MLLSSYALRANKDRLASSVSDFLKSKECRDFEMEGNMIWLLQLARNRALKQVLAENSRAIQVMRTKDNLCDLTREALDYIHLEDLFNSSSGVAAPSGFKEDLLVQIDIFEQNKQEKRHKRTRRVKKS